MTQEKYFKLNESSICVDGAKRAAIYDLKSGDIFSIDPVSKQIIGLLQEGKKVSEVCEWVTQCPPDEIVSYLKQLEEQDLGSFFDFHQPVVKQEFQTKPCRKVNFIWLELRENCNLKCRHCYSESTSESLSKKEMLTFEEWQRVIQEAYQLECRALQFIGGEPLLYGERLFELAEYARNIGYKTIEIFSNLTLLKDEWIDLIEKYQMKVATSIYSARPEIHDLITTQPGSFQKTMSSVKKLQDRGITVRFALTVMKHNQDYVDETLEFMKKMGATNPGFDVARPCGRANDKEITPDKYTIARNNARFYQVDKEEFLRRYSGNSCWQGKLSISCSGNVMPCIMHRTEPAGNVKEKPLSEIIMGDMQTYWGLSKDKIEVCKDCEYRYACQDCRPVIFGSTERLVAKDPNCHYDPYKGEFSNVN